ncbi:MAG: hypothetical protein RPT95_10380 [Candidatus Sedimenticola sp. (ex Thyasira tokunagai)]
MGSQKDIRYTEPALESVEKAQKKYKEELESIVRDQKYIPGEEFVEITASDIDRATRQVNFFSKRKSDVRGLVLEVYMVLGIVTVVLGLFYEQIRFMMQNNPTQFMLVVAGATMIAVSAISRWYFNRRQKYLSKNEKENP